MSCDESEYLTRFLGGELGDEFAITDELCCLETLYEPLQDSDMLLSDAAIASSCDSQGTPACWQLLCASTATPFWQINLCTGTSCVPPPACLDRSTLFDSTTS